MNDAAVLIDAYRAEWPRLFEEEVALIEPVLAPWLAGPIEHVGSTAVPGLAAKPVIDLMAPVADLEAARPAIDAVGVVGYVHAPYRAEVMHWLCKPSPDRRTHHLHLVPYGSELWIERLAFRDALRGDDGLANRYAALKQDLAASHPGDREAYTAGKSAFVQRALEALNIPQAR